MRAINHRGFYSKITILALKLPHKKQINTLGAATKQERWLMAQARYVIVWFFKNLIMI